MIKKEHTDYSESFPEMSDRIKEAEAKGYQRAIEILRSDTNHEQGVQCMVAECTRCPRQYAADYLEENSPWKK